MTMKTSGDDGRTTVSLGAVERWVCGLVAVAVIYFVQGTFSDVKALRSDVTEIKAKVPDHLAERLATVEARK